MYGLRVLLVDDHPVNRRVVSLFLQTMDVELVEADNGEEALSALAASPFDVVLLDMLMPVLDGPETVRRIRSSGESWSSIPVIAISAGALGDSADRYLEAGMDGYLPKPLSRDALASELERVASSSRVRMQDGRPVPPAQSATPRAGH
jgi:two-component system, sensor histidine kinase